MPTTLSKRRSTKRASTDRPKRQKRRAPHERQMITPPELAAEWGVDVQAVNKWIAAGELRAVDLSSGPNVTKRRKGITREAIAEFIARRSTTAPEKPAAAKR